MTLMSAQTVLDNVQHDGLYLALALVAALVLLAVLRGVRAPERSERVKVKRQIAAIPVRLGANGALEVLLVTTRGSGRWTVPKGRPMRGLSDSGAAAREALEEAGVTGRVHPEPIGSFEYTKRNAAGQRLQVTLYRLDVEREVNRFRERGQRERRWLTTREAAASVTWPGLATAIRGLAE